MPAPALANRADESIAYDEGDACSNDDDAANEDDTVRLDLRRAELRGGADERDVDAAVLVWAALEESTVGGGGGRRGASSGIARPYAS